MWVAFLAVLHELSLPITSLVAETSTLVSAKHLLNSLSRVLAWLLNGVVIVP